MLEPRLLRAPLLDTRDTTAMPFTLITPLCFFMPRYATDIEFHVTLLRCFATLR